MDTLGFYIYKSHSRFYTKYVSEIESDSVGDYTRCRESLKDLGMTEVSDVDCSALRYVCECVSRRAGFMVSIFKAEFAEEGTFFADKCPSLRTFVTEKVGICKKT